MRRTKRGFVSGLMFSVSLEMWWTVVKGHSKMDHGANQW